jgi:ribulose-5-phosphate 4-epimerase/fuculose-1-phosphate aldolase
MSHIEDLVIAYRTLAEEGVIDAYGHVSIRSPDDPKRYLMARNLAPELVTEGDIFEFDLDSKPVDPRGRKFYNERYIHGEIYKARPEVMAVVHNHAPAVVPFSSTCRRSSGSASPTGTSATHRRAATCWCAIPASGNRSRRSSASIPRC